jgi:hypothetical protein
MDEDYRYIPVTDHTPITHTFHVIIEPEGIRIVVAEREGETTPDEQEVPRAPYFSVTLG